MYDFLDNKNFLISKEEPFFFPKAVLPTPTWDQALSCLDECVENDLLIEEKKAYVYILYDAHIIPSVMNLVKAIRQRNPNKNFTAHMYLSLIKDSAFGKHKDEADVYFWQAQGKTRWVVDTKEGEKTFVVEQGDVIYVPNNTFHTVTSLTPRVGFSIGVE